MSPSFSKHLVVVAISFSIPALGASIVTFQQWGFSSTPTNFGSIPADFGNPTNAFASAAGSGHVANFKGRNGVLFTQANDLSFTVPNVALPGDKVIDVTLIYQLESGGKLASTNYAMRGFSFNFNFSTACRWLVRKAQFTRANSCPGSETLTVKNTGSTMVDYAAIRTECNTIPEPRSSLLAAWSRGLLLLRQLFLRVRQSIRCSRGRPRPLPVDVPDW